MARVKYRLNRTPRQSHDTTMTQSPKKTATDDIRSAPTGGTRHDAVAQVRPKDAATLIVVRGGTEPRILMGKRASTHRFMPNKFVFPGGKLDRVDQQLNVPGELSDPVMARLRKSTRAAVGDRKLRGLALAAIRETYEETGLVIGRKSAAAPRSRNTIWQEYFAHNVEPPLEHMDFIARAITPPNQNRRFDTRFFMVHDRFIQNDPERVVDASGELNEIHWMTLPEARQLDLPSITRWIIDRVEARIRLDMPTQLRQSAPFIRFINGARVTADL